MTVERKKQKSYGQLAASLLALFWQQLEANDMLVRPKNSRARRQEARDLQFWDKVFAKGATAKVGTSSKTLHSGDLAVVKGADAPKPEAENPEASLQIGPAERAWRLYGWDISRFLAYGFSRLRMPMASMLCGVFDEAFAALDELDGGVWPDSGEDTWGACFVPYFHGIVGHLEALKPGNEAAAMDLIAAITAFAQFAAPAQHQECRRKLNRWKRGRRKKKGGKSYALKLHSILN